MRVFSALDFPPGLMDLPFLKANQAEAKSARRIWSFLTQSCSLAVCAADLGLCVCVCVYSWAPFQTNKPEFCADFPDKLFLLVAQDVSQLPQWASDSIPGEVQLGWKQRQHYTFFFGFLITSFSVSEAFFLKILHFAGAASQTFSHHNFSYHLWPLKSSKYFWQRG